MAKEDMIIVSKKDIEKALKVLEGTIARAQEAYGFIEALGGVQEKKARKPRAVKVATGTPVVEPNDFDTAPAQVVEETPKVSTPVEASAEPKASTRPPARTAKTGSNVVSLPKAEAKTSAPAAAKKMPAMPGRR